jgi:hypothetical protein
MNRASRQLAVCKSSTDMARRSAKIIQSEIDRFFKAAARARVNMHMRIEPDGTIDVETTGAMSSTDEQQHVSRERLLEQVRNAR